MRTLNFNCALITGGSGGIGRAMAEYLISQNKKVIIAGRTKSTLQSTAREIGAAAYYVLDTGRPDAIPGLIVQTTEVHPDLDCLIDNAGVQRPLQVLEMKAGAVSGEGGSGDRWERMGAVVMNVSSVPGYIPISVIKPGVQRDKSVAVVEIAPPMVATNLHRERTDPDDKKKEKNPNALSVDEFMESVIRESKEGKDVIGAGMSEKVVERWYNEFGGDYEKAVGTK
ncbi:hypothetical protein W97_05343 [Coniosporium apollinis CBS 100218]|uniref:Uncharacterized protein n=1 Tax=Coniosporium apollinis (strain CBS 100218) TaxID=1168221 RepID=R7YW19_CONA1|nr:uncharacterized protein W97_05343 [Coniosporium apollinis CBS 100218]EON66100.1 hypothetical protein W97_05343 [Coniosporium apollinis CBS 100218]